MERCRPCAAKAIIKGGVLAPSLCGTVLFTAVPHGVLVRAEISGLPENDTGFFGFHIHGGKNCSGENFAGSGSHFDLNHSDHPKHSGDLPPLISFGGRACQTFITDRFKLTDIIGRTVVVHDSADDFTTQPSGNAGTKIGCGVIRLQ